MSLSNARARAPAADAGRRSPETLVKATDDLWWLSPDDRGALGRPLAIVCEGAYGKVTSKVSECHFRRC
jgi:hypothetical protein